MICIDQISSIFSAWKAMHSPTNSAAFSISGRWPSLSNALSFDPALYDREFCAGDAMSVCEIPLAPHPVSAPARTQPCCVPATLPEPAASGFFVLIVTQDF